MYPEPLQPEPDNLPSRRYPGPSPHDDVEADLRQWLRHPQRRTSEPLRRFRDVAPATPTSCQAYCPEGPR
ncbi:hypothetical protein GCM10028813_30230 [Ramlibacter alkalitolerans]